MTIIITYYLLIIIIIIIIKSHNNYCSVGVMELCLLNLLVLIVFLCNCYSCVLFESLPYVINQESLVYSWNLGNVYLVYFFDILKSRFQKSELGKFIPYFPLKNVITSTNKYVKFGPTPSRKICVTGFIESALMMMKDAFYFSFKLVLFSRYLCFYWEFLVMQEKPLD